MGLFRKLASTVTVGAIDFRSDKERTAMYARQTRNAIERQQFADRDRRAAEMTATVDAAVARAAEAQARYEKIRQENQRRWG